MTTTLDRPRTWAPWDGTGCENCRVCRVDDETRWNHTHQCVNNYLAVKCRTCDHCQTHHNLRRSEGEAK